jgi:hypothetical protein
LWAILNNPFTAGVEAEQFIDSKDNNPFANPDKKLEHLDKNYRSYSQVIE